MSDETVSTAIDSPRLLPPDDGRRPGTRDTGGSPVASPNGRPPWRRRLLAAGVLCVWALLAARLVRIQGLDRSRFAAQAQRQQADEQVVPARPGDIRDRAGRLLATTTQASSLYVDPSLIADAGQFAAEVAGPLGLHADELAERLIRGHDRRFLWVKRRLSTEEATAIRDLALPPQMWGFQSEYQRRYPQGRLAAHVLGLRDIDGVGRGGVEQGLDKWLRGKDGRRTLVRDARGFVLDVLDDPDQPPQPGRSVVLTLDVVLQLHLERRLDQLVDDCRPQSACAMVIDPATGEVLAMASRPDFDPNHPVGVAESAWLNSAIAAAYEPGSTYKPCVVAWALEQGVITQDEMFDCEHGAYRMGKGSGRGRGGRVLHDHHPYGRLSVTDVLVKSSNIGMAKIGERLGNPGLFDAAAAFGFGRRTGIELSGELAGTLHPLDAWTDYSTGSIPMGQELSATPLQIAAAHAALANRGRAVSPHLLLKVMGEAETPRNVVTSQLVAPGICRWLIETPLTQVVERGTATQARLAGLHVFGKTGTAQKIDPRTGRYSTSRHVSSFVCGAPSENPRVVVLVSVNEPTAGNDYGGMVAAPAAADILHQSLTHLSESSPRDPERTAARE